jgi:hypothetical protein
MIERQQYRGNVIGWGPWRARWYSLCSHHHRTVRRTDCHVCMTGHYVNDWGHAIDGLIYRLAYRLWHWWHNRPNSKTRRRLESFFPGLRRQGP